MASSWCRWGLMSGWWAGQGRLGGLVLSGGSLLVAVYFGPLLRGWGNRLRLPVSGTAHWSSSSGSCLVGRGSHPEQS
jgi:hypothetical protein